MKIIYLLIIFIHSIQKNFSYNSESKNLTILKNMKNYFIGIVFFKIRNNSEDIFLNYISCKKLIIDCNDFYNNSKTARIFKCDEYKGFFDFYPIFFFYIIMYIFTIKMDEYQITMLNIILNTIKTYCKNINKIFLQINSFLFN